jgi:hypothetical protein
LKYWAPGTQLSNCLLLIPSGKRFPIVDYWPGPVTAKTSYLGRAAAANTLERECGVAGRTSPFRFRSHARSCLHRTFIFDKSQASRPTKLYDFVEVFPSYFAVPNRIHESASWSSTPLTREDKVRVVISYKPLASLMRLPRANQRWGFFFFRISIRDRNTTTSACGSFKMSSNLSISS